MAEEPSDQKQTQDGASLSQSNSGGPLDAAGIEELRKNVVEILKTCYDPEIPVDIYELGLIYEVAVEPTRSVTVKMTLTTPACPAARTLPGEVEDKIYRMAGAKDVKVEVVWDPPWDKEKMSEAAKLQLGLM